MHGGLLLLTLIGITTSTNTCTYINQNKDSVSVETDLKPVAPVSSTGKTEEITIDDRESITISCKVPDSNAFEYGEETVYTCTTADTTDNIRLPLCIPKCTKLVNLVPDQQTTFHLANGTDVTNTKLAANTPVTINCNDKYAQKYAQKADQVCDAWTADALCKRMCDLSPYDNKYTVIEGVGIRPSVDTPSYLQVGYGVSITCKGSDYSLPDGAASSDTCRNPGEHIQIQSCTKMCTVPAAPTDTKYIASQKNLKQGQTFAVTCTGNLRLPYYQTVNEVTCQDDGTFVQPYPTCLQTCAINALDATTQLNKTVVGGLLAQKEAVEVTCSDPTLLLPMGYATPWIIKCGLSEPTIDIPACQQTCAVPAVPANAALERASTSTSARMRLREPITANCMNYYSYETPQGVESKQFLCLDSKVPAQVDINEFCYVYAKLHFKSGGTLKVKLTGQIVDGEDHDILGTLLDMTISGDNTNIPKTGIKPNSEVVVTVTKYEPLSVVVTTNRVISRSYHDIYPGPPSPVVRQTSSTSSTVSIELAAHPVPSTVLPYLIKYTVEYTNNGQDYTIEMLKDEKKAPLPNLNPATTYSIQTTTVLTDEFGGAGSARSFTVNTGPSPVSGITYTVKKDKASISWDPVDQAVKYEISLKENGAQLVTHTRAEPNIEYTNFKAETRYDIKIITIREVDVGGGNVEFSGDVFEKQIMGPPLGPSADTFEVTNTSDSVTVTKVNSNNVEATGLEYIVFVNYDGKQEEHKLEAGKDELVVNNLNPATTFNIEVAEAVGDGGYGMTTFLKKLITADCGKIECVNCRSTTQFDYVMADTIVTAQCMDKYSIAETDSDGKPQHLSEKKLLCNDRNQYIYTDPDQKQIVTRSITCAKQDAVIDPVVRTNYTPYIIGAVAVLIVLILIIIIVVLRRRRSRGVYNAKKVKDNTKNGATSPDGTMEPKTFVNDSAFFENKWDNELLRAQSERSKATSYGSQELRMTIADSDSGITEDLGNIYFNPALYNPNCEDDTVSTKSALV